LGLFSFSKADKILKRSEFLHLSKTGKKLHNSYFTVIFSPGQFKRSRLGITVTRKVGSSVTRNRIKRFSREYFRLHKKCLKGTWDINIIAKKEAAEITSQKTFTSLGALFRKISEQNEHE
jgi:ribonuclease P protein component